MEMPLTIIELSETMVRITCKGGKVCDVRNGREYSDVETEKDNIRYFKGV